MEGTGLIGFEPFGKKRHNSSFLKGALSPYVFACVGVAQIDNTTNYNAGNGILNAVDIATDITDDRTSFLVLPIRTGLRYDLSEKMTMGL